MDIPIKEIEEKWRNLWREKGIYKFKRDDRPLFTMDIPPPTISGDLHMGHAFSYPHQDFTARYKRMRGFNVYYQFGFDDNGLATEKYTEKVTGKSPKKIPIDEFIDLCRKQSKEAISKMIGVFERLGFSSDFSDYYHTISDESLKISQGSFLELARSGRAYNAVGPTMRCPTCGTAIAQSELKDRTFKTDFYHLKFGDQDKNIEIATTRPEMLAACVAVFVNPQDKRYKGLIGQEITVPVYGHRVSIIADDFVKMDVGSGAEMVCTFGDQNDMYLWKKHSLPARMIITPDGKIDDSNGPLSGLSIREARKAMGEILKEKGVILNVERIEHSVNVHERCDTPIEIAIERQWFIRVLDLVPRLLESGEKIDWIPQHMKVRYDNWIKGLKWDWCISRQRYNGVPFPAWRCEDCGELILADDDELPIDPRSSGPRKCTHCGSGNTIPEKDVMDTWATSSLSPRLSLSRHSLWDSGYPMNIRFQGHDIISTWAFTTITRALLHDNSIPWRNVLISGIVSDPYGAKMSKSRGNITNPEEILDEYGADAERFWACSSLVWDDIRFKEQEIIRGRRTVIKLYNASKLLLMLAEDGQQFSETLDPKSKYSRWIVQQASELVGRVTPLMDEFLYSKARSEVDSFFWNTFCDYYLEMIKVVSKEDPKEKNDVLAAGINVLLQILKMYSPIIPFSTEEIYSGLPIENRKESIHLESWPQAGVTANYVPEREEIDQVVSIISLIRSVKSQQKLESARECKIALSGAHNLLNDQRGLIETLTRTSIVEIRESQEQSVNVINDQ